MSDAPPRTRRTSRRFDRPALVALLFGFLGVGYRLVLVLLTVPGSNSDEATFGLAALHIATGRELPIFLYGQHYMGTVESYLAAPLFMVAGPGWTALRLPLVLLYAAFLLLMYRLTRTLYSPWLATATVGLLALGSERVIRDQMTAVGGRPEIKPGMVLLLLLAVALAQRRLRRRLLAFTGLGLLAGACTWDDWLVLPYLAAAGGVLLVGCGRELLGRAGLGVSVGFLIGLLPLLIDNLHAPPGQDSISVFTEVSGEDAHAPPVARLLHGTVLVSIPLATGLCRPAGCVSWQYLWGVIYLGLLAAAAVLAVAGLRAGGWRDPVWRGRYAGQFALVAAAALTLVGYARSPLAGTAPFTSARYLSILQISLPAILWPAWLAARRLVPRRPRPAAGSGAAGHDGDGHDGDGTPPARGSADPPPGRAAGGGPGTAGRGLRLAGFGAAVLLAVLTASLIAGTATMIGQITPMRDEERQARALAGYLRRAGISHVYGEYWTCNRLTFNAGEEVVCAVVGPRLRPGQNRYGPYQDQVRAAVRPGYVLEAGSGAEATLVERLRSRAVPVEVHEIDGYRVYHPRVTFHPD